MVRCERCEAIKTKRSNWQVVPIWLMIDFQCTKESRGFLVSETVFSWKTAGRLVRVKKTPFVECRTPATDS